MSLRVKLAVVRKLEDIDIKKAVGQKTLPLIHQKISGYLEKSKKI